jgi:pyruvate formate lyase activating enzyme
MLISWIQKTTLLDYPWKVATIIFTAWCNLRCQFCHNSEFVLPEKIKLIKDFIPEEIFFNFLKTKIWLLDWVVICWWEPTLQQDLIEFSKKIKSLWFLIKLDTNWRKPKMLKELLKNNLVDYIAMDIKDDFNSWQDLVWINENIQNYLESIEIIKNSNIDYEFRTTLIKNYHTQEKFENILKYILWAKKYYLQNYKWWNTLNPYFNGKSFTFEELTYFKNIALKYIENTFIRI